MNFQHKLLDLEHWMAENRGLNSSLSPPTTLDIQSLDEDGILHDKDGNGDEEDNSDGELENFDLVTSLPNVSEMESFLLDGDPFRNLQLNLHLYLLPASLAPLTRILMSTPNDRIRFSRDNAQSISNNVNLYIEKHTSPHWNWWPLQKPMARLKEGETRVHWQCVFNYTF